MSFTAATNSPSPTPQIAVLTPAGRGAVATVAVWGTGTDELVGPFFQAANGKQLTAQACGHISFGRFGEEELVVCRSASDDLEIHCHGGIAAVTAITDALTAAGGTIVSAEEYQRQRLVDLLQAEALAALANARTEYAAVQLWRMAEGELRTEFERIAAELTRGETASAVTRLENLIATWATAKHLTQPFRIVLCGQPNVGKSSLLNALVGYDRAIVFDQPGTTRDVLTATTVIDGWLVEFSDTAGLRDAGDALEQAGMDLAQTQIATADLTLVVVDATVGKLPRELPSRGKPLEVWNKIDCLPPGIVVPSTAVGTSAITGAGLPELQQAIIRRLVTQPLDQGPFIFAERQLAAVTRILAGVQRGDDLAREIFSIIH